MAKKITPSALLVSSTILISVMVLSLAVPSWSGPGESDDPLVSQSYLNAMSKLGEIKLIKNDEFQIESGKFFILVDGKAELKGVGDYKLIDLSAGKSGVRAKSLDENRLYIITGGSDVKIIARGDSIILVNGGEINPLRRGM